MTEPNITYNGGYAVMLRAVVNVNRQPVGTIIYNRFSISEGQKTFFVKVGPDAWEGISEDRADEIAARFANGPHLTIAKERLVDYERVFPAQALHMPVWIYKRSV